MEKGGEGDRACEAPSLEDIMVRNAALDPPPPCWRRDVAASAQTADGHAAHHPDAVSGAGAPPRGGHGRDDGRRRDDGWRHGPHDGDDASRREGDGSVLPLEGRIAFLKAELAVTDAQAAQWNAFADAYRENAKAMRDSMAGITQADQPANAADRSDAMVTMMSAHVDSLKAIAAAEKALYAVLTDSQKATADELLGGPSWASALPDGRQVHLNAAAAEGPVGAGSWRLRPAPPRRTRVRS